MTRFLSSLAVPAICLASLSAGAVEAQESAKAVGGVRVESMSKLVQVLEHQPAREAFPLIESLLSPDGVFEVPDANTLVVRDHASVVEKLAQELKDFDHPLENVDLEVYVLDASARQSEEPEQDPQTFPEPLRAGLAQMLRFNHYELRGEGQVSVREGEEIRYQIGPEYAVRFTVGTVLGGQRLRLRSLEVARRSPDGDYGPVRPPFNLNLTIDRLLLLSLASAEGSERSLVVGVRAGVQDKPTVLEPSPRGGS